MPDNQELIWVDKDFAERWKELTKARATREQQLVVFDEYVKGVTDYVRKDFKANLEGLGEDAAMFTGLMLKVKQAFEKAKNEQLNATYELWEKFEAEIPSTKEKVDKILQALDPLEKKLTSINALIGKISTYNIDKLNESLSMMASLYGANREMVEFLVVNFGKEKNKDGQ